MAVLVRPGEALQRQGVTSMDNDAGRVTNALVEPEQLVERLEHEPDARPLDNVKDLDALGQIELEAPQLALRLLRPLLVGAPDLDLQRLLLLRLDRPRRPGVAE